MNKIFILLALFGAVNACSYTKTEPAKVQGSYYADDAARYRENVAVKAQGKQFVTYEYKDIRIDELAPLAAKYCDDNFPGKHALLRDIILYRNNLRRATFDCLNLAKES